MTKKPYYSVEETDRRIKELVAKGGRPDTRRKAKAANDNYHLAAHKGTIRASVVS